MPMNPGMLDQTDGPPRTVLVAVALLGILFFFGGVYLLMTNPFSGTEVVAPAEMPEVVAALTDYRGTILGLELRRQSVNQELAKSGLDGGEPITLYPTSPFFMRPIDIQCRVGYLLTISRPLKNLTASVQLEQLSPGKCLIVRVKGKGNFTGNKAYKAAARFLSPMGLMPAEGARYEKKISLHGQAYVEHWIPVKIKM